MLSGVIELLTTARRAVARNVNTLMTATYWEIGRRVIENEQQGQKWAGYGEEVLARLAVDLMHRFGRGFSVDSVVRFRLSYSCFPAFPISATSLRKSADVPDALETLHRVGQQFPLP